MPLINLYDITMKFLLTLSIDSAKHGNCLPLNYQYEISSFIYAALTRADAQYSHWLHENGFAMNPKGFRLFSFSNFIFTNFTTKLDRIHLNAPKCGLVISLLPAKSTPEFIRSVFLHLPFSIGDQQSKVAFEVTNIEALTPPDLHNPCEFVTLSPVCITRKAAESGKLIYESPESPYACGALLLNLKNKYKAFYGTDYQGDSTFELKLLNEPRSKLIAIHNHTAQQRCIKGYNFNFEVQAPPELLHLMYECGLGEKNTLGFGAVETKENVKLIRGKLK